MPRHLLRTLPIAALLAALAGCSSTKAPEPFPGFESADPATLSTIREADHVFVGSIDGRPIPQFDVNLLEPGQYRQHQVPAGKHTLAVYYRAPWGYDSLAAGPREVEVNVEAGRSYVLRANRESSDIVVDFTVRTADWRPELVDQQTLARAGRAPIDR